MHVDVISLCLYTVHVDTITLGLSTVHVDMIQVSPGELLNQDWGTAHGYKITSI